MALVIIAVLFGIVARTLIPFLQVLKENPETKFDRKFVVPAVATLIVSLLVSPFVFVALPPEQVNQTSPTFISLCVLFVAAWGTNDVLRQVQKLISG